MPSDSLPNSVEELLEALDGAVLAYPQQADAALFDLVDEGEVFMPLGVLDLIDPNGPDRAERAVSEPPRHHIFHRLADLVPSCVERHGGFPPRQQARPMGEKQHIGDGQLVLADRPRHLFDMRTAAGFAIDPPHLVNQLHRETPERDEIEAAHAEVIVAAPRPMAARAHRLGAAPRPHVDFDRPLVAAQPRLRVDEARNVVAVVEDGDQLHGSKSAGEGQAGSYTSQTGSQRPWRPRPAQA